MTDEQLRAVARRIIGLVALRRSSIDGDMYDPFCPLMPCEQVDAAAVKILREALDAPTAYVQTAACKVEMQPLNPTQSFVASTGP